MIVTDGARNEFCVLAILTGFACWGVSLLCASRSVSVVFSFLPSMRKYVVSSTLTDAEATWNNTKVLRGDFSTDVAKLRTEPSGDVLVHGSAKLVQGLIEHDLVDELRLMVFPVVLGSGKRLYSESGKTAKLELTSSKALASGILLLTYRPARAA